MTIHHILTLPGWYTLYAVYFDFYLNNAQHLESEEAQRLHRLLYVTRPPYGVGPAWRKSLALRLFTERELLRRHPPHEVKAAWDELNHRMAIHMNEALGKGKGMLRHKVSRLARQKHQPVQTPTSSTHFPPAALPKNADTHPKKHMPRFPGDLEQDA